MPNEAAYIRNFKQFTREPLMAGELSSFESEAYTSSDRSLAVMLSSVLENALDELIESKLRHDLSANSRRLLFDMNGPLGTFSARTIVAYALGMVGPDTQNDIDLIRTLRNGFAHC